jgi:DNA repair protein RAD7
MYDCTNLANQSYLTLANLCPNLESLRLDLCGQLTTEAITYWGENLKLKRLELYAPFLVRKPGWLSLFKSLGEKLEVFLVTQSPRIDVETIESLVEYCPNLTELRLAEIGQLNGDCLSHLAKLKHLVYLDLSSPATSLSDDSVVDLLTAIGPNLTSLNLDNNLELTDEILPAISRCSNLRHLSLRNLPELTDQGVSRFFDDMQAHPGFVSLDFEKGHDLGSKAVKALVKHSAHSLETLNMPGWKEADEEALSSLAKCTHLKSLDLGWCRQVTDYTLKDILDACTEIATIRVWGECEGLLCIIQTDIPRL